MTGSTCRPSTIRPAINSAFASVAPAGPGTRALIGPIALNRWVTPRTPARDCCVDLVRIGHRVAGAHHNAVGDEMLDHVEAPATAPGRG